MRIGHSSCFGFFAREAYKCKYLIGFLGQVSAVRDFFVSVAGLVKPILISGICMALSSLSNITGISLIQFRVIGHKQRLVHLRIGVSEFYEYKK